MLSSVGKSDHRECFRRAFLPLGFVDLCVQRRQLCIFEGSGACQQIEALKNKSNFLIPNEGQCFFVVPRYIDPFEQVASRAGAVKTTKHVHESRFTATARSHDCQELTTMNIDAHTAQRMDSRFSEFI